MLMVEEFEMWDQDGQGACGRQEGRQEGGQGGRDRDVGEQGEEWRGRIMATERLKTLPTRPAPVAKSWPQIKRPNLFCLLSHCWALTCCWNRSRLEFGFSRWFCSSPANIYLFATSWKTELNIAHIRQTQRMCKITEAIKMTFYEDIIIKYWKELFEINKALTRTKFLEELLFIQLEEGKFQWIYKVKLFDQIQCTRFAFNFNSVHISCAMEGSSLRDSLGGTFSGSLLI